jgi:hypothetical protein
MSHTPGPWGWTDGEKPIDIATYESPGFYQNPQLRSESGEDIVGCDEYWTIGPMGNDEEVVANARLIAAAPDMLAALNAVVGASETGFPEALQSARDAIKKARGEK